jgi:hypothetical protein
VKQGLPQDGLPVAAKNAIALWEVARLGTTPKMAYAEKLGRKSAAGGGWDRLVAVLRGFGLLRVEGDQVGLSPLGQDMVNGSDPAKQMAARRTAMLHLKAYKDLITNFDGTSLPDKTALASKLKFEYGKSDDFAAKAAQAFLDSLVFAEMIDAQGRVRKNGADAPQDPAPEDEGDGEQADLIDDAFEAEDEAEDDEGGAADENVATAPEGGLVRLNGAAQVTISVTLDLSKYRADEVIQILKVLNG